MKCAKCGHGRQLHRRGRGKLRLPCQAIDYVPYSYETSMVIKGQEQQATISGRRITPCKCRDFKEVTK